MSLHLDRTMDVRLADGTIERRPYSIHKSGSSDSLLTGTRGGFPIQYEPELKEGETILWTVGDLIPTIVETGR